MWFFIVEGYHHTRSLEKYLIRLFAFAFISHFAYCFAFDRPFVPNFLLRGVTSIMWPLAWSVVLLAVLDSKVDKKLKIVSAISILIITFASDWGRITVPIIALMNKYRGDFKKQMLVLMLGTFVHAVSYFMLIDTAYGIIQLATWLAVPVLYFYNGKRDKLKLKYLFYVYYPLHLVIVGILRLALQGKLAI